jgi:NADPH2:quinone reductase
MKHTRIIVTHYGGPDALEVLEEERPEPKDGQVRVRVLAAVVALPDVMAREGVHPETPRYPSPQGGIWLVWWIGLAMVSPESNQAR